ncbi:MAG: hypothetical protein Q8P59_04450, partial [Dehalococcoidia bacterium]|nr:hypothetical protein [Dehalococcoidia bacterium]
ERGTGAPAQLQSAARVRLGYDAKALGTIAPGQLSVHYYDSETNAWVSLPSQVDTINRLVTAETSHFSDYALLADLPPMPVKVYLPVASKVASGW